MGRVPNRACLKSRANFGVAHAIFAHRWGYCPVLVGISNRYRPAGVPNSRLTCDGAVAAIISGEGERCPVRRLPFRRVRPVVRTGNLVAPRPAGVPFGRPRVQRDTQQATGVRIELRKSEKLGERPVPENRFTKCARAPFARRWYESRRPQTPAYHPAPPTNHTAGKAGVLQLAYPPYRVMFQL